VEGSNVKRLVVAAALAAGIMTATAVPAGAMFTYCDWDPLVLIITPAGHIVPVYDSVWTPSPLDLGLPLESYAVKRVYDKHGNPETLVTMKITTPTGLLFWYSTTDEVTTGLLGSGTVLARAGGNSWTPTYLKFILHEP
jgi:hypothetical protein